MNVDKPNLKYLDVRIPALCVLDDGTLLGAYEMRKGRGSDWGHIDIRIMRSVDEGKSWKTVTVIEGGGETINNPTFITNGKTVHFLYCVNYFTVYHLTSVDGGKTFANKKDISCAFDKYPHTVVAIGPGHGVYHNGNLIAPVWIVNRPDDPKSHFPSFITTVYSTDGGESWQCGEVIGKNFLVTPSECSVAINGANEVLISIRNENPEKLRALATSKNGFSDWENLRLCKNLPDPICMGSLVGDGKKVYSCNCNSQTGRNNLTVKISTDDFNSFEEVFLSKGAGYSDIAFFKNKLYILHEIYNQETSFEIYFKAIDL